MAQENREEDRRTLIAILNLIENRLYVIVFNPEEVGYREPLLRREFIGIVREPWRQVQASFLRSREMIEKDEINWEYVEGFGMTGDWLRWKKLLLDETLKQGVAGRFLKVANSILGSLSKAIPPLEIVKEYKEHVEAAMRFPNR